MKKPKVKFVEVSDPEQIASLFEALGMEVPEELQRAMPEPEEDKPCGNPVCPCCCFKGETDANIKRVEAVFKLLTPEQLVQSSTLLFGIAAGAYMQAPFPHDLEIGEKIAALVKLLRKTNAEFAFATTPNDNTEGVAKH